MIPTYTTNHRYYKQRCRIFLQKSYPNLKIIPNRIHKAINMITYPDLSYIVMSGQSPISAHQPFSLLFKIFENFLFISHIQGLINLNSLQLAGDGTPLVTASRERSKAIVKGAKAYELFTAWLRHWLGFLSGMLLFRIWPLCFYWCQQWPACFSFTESSFKTW